MSWSFTFFLNSVLLGIGLAMDAFSVSAANGLNEPQMKAPKMYGIAGTFAGFQILMPLIGWVCVHTIAQTFTAFQKFIPWIALILLCIIGGNMLIEGIKFKNDEGKPGEKTALGVKTLVVQGIATSIDALSVGFTIAELPFLQASVECLIIGAMTMIICIAGLLLGKGLGTKLSGKASIFGGLILIGIGIEIFVTSFLH